MHHRTRSLALLPLLLVAVVMAACGGTATPSSAPVTAACTPVDIRTPNGEPIDLTGRWSGNDPGLYDLKQIDNCLWWVGMSNFPDQEPGQSWRNAFRGTIAGDLTITGEFVDVFGTNPGSGTLRLRIVTAETENGTEVQLTREAADGHPYGGTFWERVEAEAPDPDASGDILDPSGTLGGAPSQPVASGLPTPALPRTSASPGLTLP